MEEDHYSGEWDDAPMPHSIFFTRIGHAIHGTLEVKRLGTAASHGCVRLEPANAATLFALVRSEGLKNTKVVVTGVEPVAVAGQRQGLPRDVGSSVAATRNWDNTIVRDNRPPWERQAPPFFGGAPQAWPPPQRF